MGSDDGHNTTEFPPNASLSPPSLPRPLHLCGFHTGDTVQVRGDTGGLQFSIQFNLRTEERRSDDAFNFPDANIPETENFHDSMQSSSLSSPYLTPISSPTPNLENDENDAGEILELCGEASPRGGVMTRLRSGALSPIKYYFGGIYGGSVGSLRSGKKRKSKMRKWKGDNVFEEMLRRRSLPLRPCNSYGFFLMKNWGIVKRSSFAETSKRLSKQWSHLHHDVKKEYEHMALKDNARYKRQCLLLKNDVDQGITSCSS